MANKNFVGSGWKKTFENGGAVLNMSLKLEALNKLPVDKYGNINIVAGARKSPDEGKSPDEKSKATHWVAEDEYRSQKIRDESGF